VVPVETFRDPTHPEVTQGVGVFTFTPQAGKAYQLKIDQPAEIEERFALPAVKSDGVVLSIPAGVTSDNEPIKAMIGSVGGDRSLMIGVYCRGRLMTQQSVDVKKGEVEEVKLGPESGVGGVYRVTAFERAPDQTRGERLEPRAERLIYRRPAGRLRLNIQPDKTIYAPGQQVHVRIRTTNEHEQPQPALALVAVVDEAALRLAHDNTYQSALAQFMLTTEVRRLENLEHANFLLSGEPQAAKALDLLLGVQGWRRFAEQDPGRFQKEHKEEALRLLALQGQWPPRSLNYGQETVQKAVKEFHTQYAVLEKRLTDAEDRQVAAPNNITHRTRMMSLHQDTNRTEIERTVTSLRIKSAQEALADAADKFQRYRELLQEIILPALLIVFLLASVANLVLAFRRRSRGQAIPYLAGAACSLLLVALAMNQRANLAGTNVTPQTQLAESSEQPNRGGIADMKLDEDGQQPPMPKPSPDKAQPGPLLAPVKPIVPQPKNENAPPPAAKQDQLAPTDHRNLLPRLPVPSPSAPPFVVQEHAYFRGSGENKERFEKPDTLFWHPILVLPDGTAEISFDLGDSVATYQVIVAGQTIDGRLGEEVINIPIKKPGDH
jgi:hypothetical protein